MSRAPNLEAIRMRIKQVEIELERLRMLERLAVMQQEGGSPEQPSPHQGARAGAAAP